MLAATELARWVSIPQENVDGPSNAGGVMHIIRNFYPSMFAESPFLSTAV